MRGFTLIEIVIAVAIVGILAGGLFGTFSRTISSRDYAQRHATVFASARRAIDLIESDLSGLYPTGSFDDRFADPVPRFYAVRDPVLSSRDDNLVVLDFTAVSSRGTTPLDGLGPLPPEGLDRGDLARIIYRLEIPANKDAEIDPTSGRPFPELVRYEVRPSIAEALAHSVRVVVLDSVGALSFRMRGPRGSWQTNWDSRPAGGASGRAPFLFETRIDIPAPPEGMEAFRSTTYLPITAQP